ncbi:MAG: hypothetical protein ABH875_05215, partial [Candidatus Omnitrophota bacterium]
RRYAKSASLSFLLFFIVTGAALAGGLSTTFIEETLEGLEPGKTYSIEEVNRRPLIVKNTTEDMTVDIAIEPELPVDYNLVPGYEPLPDTSWVMIEKTEFKEVGPGQSAETDVIISIPLEAGHRGKKYQIYIYSHTVGGATFRTGLMSRVLIHISE